MAKVSKLSIMVADDHALVREGLRRLIDEQHDMAVVGEASSGPEALALAQRLSPALALVDVSMPGWDGVTITQALAATCPQIKVVAVTRHTDKAFVTRMIQAGGSGYVLKQSPSAELLRAVRAVAAGQQYIDPSIQSDPPAPREPAAAPQVTPSVPAGALSGIEESVLRLVGAAYSNREIAEHCGLAVSDVLAVKASAMRKTGLHGRVQVVDYARSRGWR